MQTELAQREALLAQLTESLPLGVIHLGPDGRISLKNHRWAEMTGVEPPNDRATLISQSFNSANVVLAELNRAAESGIDANVPVQFNSPTGGLRNGRLRQIPISVHDGDNPGAPRPGIGMLSTLDDITETVHFQTELERLAKTDRLTKLLNRFGIEEETLRLLAEARGDARHLRDTVDVGTVIGIAGSEPNGDFDTFTSRADQMMYIDKRRQRENPSRVDQSPDGVRVGESSAFDFSPRVRR